MKLHFTGRTVAVNRHLGKADGPEGGVADKYDCPAGNSCRLSTKAQGAEISGASGARSIGEQASEGRQATAVGGMFAGQRSCAGKRS